MNEQQKREKLAKFVPTENLLDKMAKIYKDKIKEPQFIERLETWDLNRAALWLAEVNEACRERPTASDINELADAYILSSLLLLRDQCMVQTVATTKFLQHLIADDKSTFDIKDEMANSAEEQPELDLDSPKAQIIERKVRLASRGLEYTLDDLIADYYKNDEVYLTNEQWDQITAPSTSVEQIRVWYGDSDYEISFYGETAPLEFIITKKGTPQ